MSTCKGNRDQVGARHPALHALTLRLIGTTALSAAFGVGAPGLARADTGDACTTPTYAACLIDKSGAPGSNAPPASTDKSGTDGTQGGPGGAITHEFQGSTTITAPGEGAAILFNSDGGQGGNGADGNVKGGLLTTHGGNGSPGGSGGTATLVLDPGVRVTANTSGSAAVLINANGSPGGSGGRGGYFGNNGTSADGGAGGAISASVNGTVVNTGDGSAVLELLSRGGDGGNGPGYATGYSPSGVAGGNAGAGGAVNVMLGGALTSTSGPGIIALSAGGNGGTGGPRDTSIEYAQGGHGGDGGGGQSVTVTLNSGASLSVGSTYGIWAQSLGGAGGAGGQGSGTAGSGQDGGPVSVTNNGTIAYTGQDAPAILAQSLGGVGASGGKGGGWQSSGGAGGSGGSGGSIAILGSGGSIASSGTNAAGIIAQSTGGGGGAGGDANGWMAIGGNGGVAANGGNITVNITNAIKTTGERSEGILVQSIGGGGGNGGNATGSGVGLNIVIGGTAGGGGAGGEILAANGGLISTAGLHATGLVLQSIGGGGGKGGAAYSKSYSGALGASVSVGGAGGAGGSGRTIDLVQPSTPTNSGQIVTSGADSFGILAQSIGGGGGVGGASGATAKTYAVGQDVPTISMAVAIGGGGGVGGSGNLVNLLNAGLIATTGQGSAGIVAQSIGGGGGTGGDSSATATASGGDSPVSIASSFSIGGIGGGAGNGGAISLANTGLIVTTGESADGLLAQSIGGGGGNGGAGDGQATSTTKGNGLTIATNMTLGGGAGSGGNTASVAVSNAGAILTLGDGSAGIMAQAVGGGGGRGGGGAGTSSGTFNGSESIGGRGGNGGAPAANTSVTVNNSGAIVTFGASAAGIVAQSIGGGGGAGGKAASSIGAKSSTGDGGNGNTSSLASTISSLQSAFATGQGAVAQYNSIAGLTGLANGLMGNSKLGAVRLGSEPAADAEGLEQLGSSEGDAGDGSKATSLSVNINIGGQSGQGGNGGTVVVGNTGSIGTIASMSDGILAQSIGGGGGVGGASTSSTTDNAVQGSISVGGTGGSGGNGGNVTVTNGGTIITIGGLSAGIVAQSIAGGGGVGGTSGAKVQPGKDPKTSVLSVPISIGGNGGGSGTAGPVSVTNTGSILTRSHDAIGVIAQSVAGGGGIVKTLSTDAQDNNGGASTANGGSYQINLSFGGSRGSSGNANTVTVTNTGSITTGYIETNKDGTVTRYGRNAYGILAQSIGGGGGLVLGGSPNSGTNVFGSGRMTGDGGAVNVTLGDGIGGIGSIATMGTGAVGILAQSIGGGGGLAGDTGQTAQRTAFAGSSSHSGNGGPVTVTLNAGSTVQTTADNTPAILAQSIGGGGGRVTSAGSPAFDGTASGSGFGGAIGVNVAGTVSAAGSASPGIFAEIAGQGGTPPAGSVITVKVAQGGTVSGGTDYYTGDGYGAGVYLVGGGQSAAAPNLIDNSGTITSAGGAGGTAIYSTSGYVKVTNESTGTITGAIALDNNGGSGSCSGSGSCPAQADFGVTRGDVVNQGVIQSQSIRLGGGTLTNAGTLDVRSGGNGTATLVGNYHAVAGGVLHVGADFARGAADRLLVVGKAELDPASTVRVDVGSWARGSVPVLTATDTPIQNPPAAEASNSTYLFGLKTAQAGNTLQVQTTSNIATAATGLTANQRNVAASLEQVWNAGGSATATSALATVGDARGYRVALSSLMGASVGGVAAAKQAASERFTDNLINCEPYRGAGILPKEESCVWLRTAGAFANLASDGDVPGYRQSTVTSQVGGQKEVAPGWFVGASAGYETSWLIGGDDGTKVSGESVLSGVMLKRQSGPWLLSGVLDGGYGWYRSNRQIQVGSVTGQASGSPNVAHAGLHLRAAYLVSLGDWYVRPNATIEAVYRGMSGYREAGATPFNLAVRSSSDIVGAISPMVEAGRGSVLPGGIGTLRGFAAVGAAFYTNNDWQTRAGFEQAPAGIGQFTATSKQPWAVAKLRTGLDLFTVRGIEAKLTYDAQFAPGYAAQSITGRLAYAF